jgi:DNA mismatch repair protein MutS
VRNVSVAAREWKGEVVFLRKLVPGGANRSFGVEVAKLAGLPEAVIARAGAILRSLEAMPAAGARPGPAQLGLFAAPTAPAAPVVPEPGVAEVAETLRAVDPDDLSPRAAHQMLVELKRKLTQPP